MALPASGLPNTAPLRAGVVTPLVVLALKRTLPADAGVMSHELAYRLARWATDYPDPYRHVHWQG